MILAATWCSSVQCVGDYGNIGFPHLWLELKQPLMVHEGPCIILPNRDAVIAVPSRYLRVLQVYTEHCKDIRVLCQHHSQAHLPCMLALATYGDDDHVDDYDEDDDDEDDDDAIGFRTVLMAGGLSQQ